METENFDEWNVLVGRVRGHWNKSDLKIQPFSQAEGRFSAGARLLAVSGGQKRLLEVRKTQKIAHHWICDCGLASTAEALALTAAELFVHPSMRPALPEGEFYLDELLGFEIVTENGENWGEIEEVLEGPAHNVYVTACAMIPGHPDFIVASDWEKKILTVRDVPGLKTDK